MRQSADQPTLKRSLNLPLMVLYGLGTTVGGGIYVLIGSVAGRAGLFTPVSFVMAAALTAFTALTFAELSARYPKSAGEAVYVEEGFNSGTMAAIVGYLVITSGIVSSAALTIGFSGYFRELVPLPDVAATLGVIVLLGLITAWGIGESVTVAALITVIEIGGLVLIIWVGADHIGTVTMRIGDLVPPFEMAAWTGILAGSFLAYYAFIGFEDMVNVAEEVKDVRRTLPAAIIITLIVTTFLYAAVSLVATLSLPASELADAPAPLALLYERQTGRPATIIAIISLFAVINGALIQIIMATRVIYGMSQRQWLPQAIGQINQRTRTPVRATLLVTVSVAILALGFKIETLAQIVTIGIVLVGLLVNGALLRLKITGPPVEEHLSLPIWIPTAGAMVSFLFVILATIDLISRF